MTGRPSLRVEGPRFLHDEPQTSSGPMAELLGGLHATAEGRRILEGRRAIIWSGLTNLRRWAYYDRVSHDDWTVRASRPRRRYGQSTAHQGSHRRKVHLVRDVLIATRTTGEEVRMTRWWCGTHAWNGELITAYDGPVCSVCAARIGTSTTRQTAALRKALA